MQHDLQPFFAGEKLYGDDFTPEQIEAWYRDEAEGYADLGAKDTAHYQYVYHALNAYHGFRYLSSGSFSHALGFGSAYGDEFEPIAGRIARLTILDPSDAFVRDTVHGIPTVYRKPDPSGLLPFEDETFDLITCLGVLHHIPNVSTVLAELRRSLRPGGYLLLREPIISMGDWRHPRSGLTRHERGIPLPLLRRMIAENGFEVVSERLCMFPVIARLATMAGKAAYNSPFATRLDAVLSRLTAWNLRYHATTLPAKFRPTSAYYVLRVTEK